jgi:hypothetical protein
MLWFGNDVYRNSSIEFGIFLFCFVGWITFTFVGISIITQIVDYLTKNFEDIKKKQKEVQKTSEKKRRAGKVI